MLEFLQSIDLVFFHFVNQTISNVIFDDIMPILTDYSRQRITLIFAAILIGWMLVKGGRRGRIAVLTLAVTILLSDQLNSTVIKGIFGRPRPCHILTGIRLLIDCGPGFAFPSSHAVNNFAGALALSHFYPKTRLWLLVFASLIAFSRVYVGVHYPFDVIGGALFGLGIGYVTTLLADIISKKINSIMPLKSKIKLKKK